MKKHLIIIALISLALVACGKNEAETPSAETNSKFIEISNEQFENEKMSVGKIEEADFPEVIDFNGVISTKSGAAATVSLQTPGIISKIHVQPGSKVNSGTALFTISGNELIDLQRDYAESIANHFKLKKELDKTKELQSENIGTKKELYSAESAFKAETARLNALKLKLKNIGINPDKISNGEFVNSYTIKSPITGYITDIKASIGQFANAGDVLASILNDQDIILKLSIFEQDINKVRLGQEVLFALGGDSANSQTAKITAIGKQKNEDNKSIDCYAEINNFRNINAVVNSFVQGKIILSAKKQKSLPESAFINSAEGEYILKIVKKDKNQISVEKILVKTGSIVNGRKQILNEVENAEYLINGIYNIHL